MRHQNHNLSFKLTKNQRLLNSHQFKQVFNACDKKIHSENLLVFIKENSTDNCRLGMAITKKKLKNATDRNRLKRLIREYFRLNQYCICGIDIVVIVKQKYDKKINIHDQLSQLFSKIIQHYPNKDN